MRVRDQHGVALVTALLVVALATTAAVSMATRQQLDIRRTGNLLHSEQAYAYARGAEAWARVVLARDRKDSEIDTLFEDWATQLPASLVEGGSVVGRVMDMQSRFNLNSLINIEGKADADAITSYKRLLRSLELEEGLADPLVDWMDTDIDTRFPDGAEDAAYLLLEPAYRAANRPLADISELRLVKGYEVEIVEKLRPYVTVLPEPTPINVNTASAQVLITLAPDMSVADGEALVEARGETGYEKMDDFLRQPALAGKPAPVAISLKSQWFMVVSESDIGQGRARLASLIQRTDKDTLVVRRLREFVEPVVLEVETPAP